MTNIIYKATVNSKDHICETCHSYHIKSRIPAQAVSNKLEIYPPQTVLKDPNRLEKALISQRILF